MKYAEQVRRFKHLVPIGPKTVPELIEVLKSKVDVEEMSVDALYPQKLALYKFNIMHSSLGEKLQGGAEELTFRVFRVIMNEKGRPYFEPYFGSEGMIDTVPPEYFYVIFEEKTGYVDSRSNSLASELRIARGVSQQDVDSESIAYRSLLASIALDHCREHGEEDSFAVDDSVSEELRPRLVNSVVKIKVWEK